MFKYKILIRRLLLMLLTITAFTSIGINQSYAQDVRLGIHPSIIEIEADRGTHIRETITVFGQSGDVLYLSAELFEADGIYGHIRNYVPDHVPFPMNPLQWITFSANPITLTSTSNTSNHTSAQFIVDINVPQGAQMGDYYLTIFAGERDDRNIIAHEHSSKILGKIGTNLILSIRNKNYKPVVGAKVVTFEGDRVQFERPFKLEGIIENTGNARIKTIGEVRAYPFMGIFSDEYTEVGMIPVNVMAGAQRYVLTDINEEAIVIGSRSGRVLGEADYRPTMVERFLDYMPNIYKAELVVTPDQEVSETATFTFLYLPIPSVVFVLAIVLIIFIRLFVVKFAKGSK